MSNQLHRYIVLRLVILLSGCSFSTFVGMQRVMLQLGFLARELGLFLAGGLA